jgi:hypothetical protein
VSDDELTPKDRAIVDRAVDRMRDIQLRRLAEQLPAAYTIVERELLVRADSYLSLLYYRHSTLMRNDPDRTNIERTINQLRKASS